MDERREKQDKIYSDDPTRHDNTPTALQERSMKPRKVINELSNLKNIRTSIVSDKQPYLTPLVLMMDSVVAGSETRNTAGGCA